MTVNNPIPFQNLPIVTGLTGAEIIPLDQGGTTKTATVRQVSIAFIQPFPSAIEAVIDGGGTLIQTGMRGYLSVPFPVTLSGVVMYANVAGNISVDIWKCTTAQFDAGLTHPVVGDSITGGVPPALVGASLYQNTALGGWTTSFATGDVLAYNVGAGVVGITRITIVCNLTRVLT